MRKAIINQCSNEDFWYSELVGFPELARFEIVSETDEDYIININNGFSNLNLPILKKD